MHTQCLRMYGYTEYPVVLVDGLGATPILNMCLRYQEHLSTVASVMANEQVSEMACTWQRN